MATTITFEAYTPVGNNGPAGGKISGTVSMNDVVVNVSPNSTGGWNTATVTADKQRSILLGPTDAASAAMPQGQYINQGGAVYRLQL